MTMTRRRFLCGCGCSLLLPTLIEGRAANATEAGQPLGGCLLLAQAGNNNEVGCGPVASSGSAELDAAFAQEFARQREFFQLPDVTFHFFNDCNGMNALAAPDPPAIWFGVNLARDLYSRFSTTLPLWQAMAHEFGHQMQNKHGHAWLDQPTVVRDELEADMFSGFYLGAIKNANPPSEIQTILPLAFSLGDREFNNPNHHGTPLQRVSAVFHGVIVAFEYYSGAIEQSVPAMRGRFAWNLPV